MAGAAAAAPPAAETEASEGEEAALMGLAAAMGAPPALLASWNETVTTSGSLCGWGSPAPLCETSYDCGYDSAVQCDPASGAITNV